ncbi:hypothetical protein HD806DRAFT_529978 [Xylariaceae sp. AK1471]|nr:hypothetical protein HD806DRAFT_529978 [Xylariaceae sp. AK1471]
MPQAKGSRGTKKASAISRDDDYLPAYVRTFYEPWRRCPPELRSHTRGGVPTKVIETNTVDTEAQDSALVTQAFSMSQSGDPTPSATAASDPSQDGYITQLYAKVSQQPSEEWDRICKEAEFKEAAQRKSAMEKSDSALHRKLATREHKRDRYISHHYTGVNQSNKTWDTYCKEAEAEEAELREVSIEKPNRSLHEKPAARGHDRDGYISQLYASVSQPNEEWDRICREAEEREVAAKKQRVSSKTIDMPTAYQAGLAHITEPGVLGYQKRLSLRKQQGAGVRRQEQFPQKQPNARRPIIKHVEVIDLTQDEPSSPSGRSTQQKRTRDDDQSFDERPVKRGHLSEIRNHRN